MANKIALVTDSTAYIPDELCEKYHLTVALGG
jgi:fatty acid-binding protein DegV